MNEWQPVQCASKALTKPNKLNCCRYFKGEKNRKTCVKHVEMGTNRNLFIILYKKRLLNAKTYL